MDNVEIIDIPRTKFDEEHGISKHVQGYTFIRGAGGNNVGIVFRWYRNRVERHIKEEVTPDKKTWANTSRPVNPSSYKINMDVYIGETMWDRDTGEKIDEPKYRIKDKLTEIYRVDG